MELQVISIAQNTSHFIKSRVSGTTVFTRLSATALFKFSELQMRRSFGGGAQSVL
jgi:hypothetical protein